MQNDINSCIIEGTMGKAPDENGKFYVVTKRVYKNETTGEKLVQRTHIFVVANGNFKKIAEQNYAKDRGIRIVGRLQTDRRGRAEIYAEHIEFKPVFDINATKTAED